MEKYIKLFIFFIFFSTYGYGQTYGLSVSINENYTGTGINLRYLKPIKSFVAGVGLSYHFNYEPAFRDGGSYNHTLYAKNTFQRFGLSGLIDYKIPFKIWRIKPLVGYHFQLIKTARKVIWFSTDLEPTLFEWDIPLTMWTNFLLLGLNFEINKNFNINLYGGVGHSLIYNLDESIIEDDKNPFDNKSWEFNNEFSFTLIYWLQKNQKEK